MPLITGLEIDNFRCFKRLRVEGLTRVNLIVGANNAGKTALLEAVEAVASVESPFILYRASLERGESRSGRGDGGEQNAVRLDVRRWFFGHELDEASFEIRATGGVDRTVSRSIKGVPPDATAPFVPSYGFALTLRQSGSSRGGSKVTTLPVSPEGWLGAGPPSRFVGYGLGLRPPVSFVTTRGLLPPELVQLWASIVLTPREESTVTALRLIEPTIERVAISGGPDGAVVQVLLRDAKGPIPLGTLGEGVSRIFSLALHLATAKGGVLLVDEIESGLHWSVMPRVWRFLLSAARELDVQIFATTHSKDCLEALAQLYRDEPGLAGDVSVHRLEAGKAEAVRMDARIIELATEGSQEVR